MKDKTIKSDALQEIKGYINPQNDIVDIEVKGRWLTATLKSGVKFSVLNKDYGN